MNHLLVSHWGKEWRFNPKTRNILAADGAIVCRTGDSVYTEPGIAELLCAAPKLYQALMGMVAYHDSKFRSNRLAAIATADDALKSAQPKT